MKAFRVEREWIPLKTYLPAVLYAKILELKDQDIVYREMAMHGNEEQVNAIIRMALTQWIKYRELIEEQDGTKEYRKKKIASLKILGEETHENTL